MELTRRHTESGAQGNATKRRDAYFYSTICLLSDPTFRWEANSRNRWGAFQGPFPGGFNEPGDIRSGAALQLLIGEGRLHFEALLKQPII